MKYLPLGGVTAANMADYLREPAIVGIGGSWLAPLEAIRARDWPRITAAAREASALAHQSVTGGGVARSGDISVADLGCAGGAHDLGKAASAGTTPRGD